MFNDQKFTAADIAGNNLSFMPDRPSEAGYTAAQLKESFGYALRVKDVMEHINGLIDALQVSTAAAELGASISGISAQNIQGILTEYASRIANRYTKAETDALVGGETGDLVANVNVNLTSGVITVTKKDGTVQSWDTALEKVPASFALVESGGNTYLRITNVDGTYTQTDVTSLMNIYDHQNSDDIAFTVTGTGPQKTVTATVRPHSITMEELSLTVVSQMEGYVSSAADSATSAGTSAASALASKNAAASSEANSLVSKNTAVSAAATSTANAATATTNATLSKSYAVGGTNTRPGEDTDNAKYWAQQSRETAQGDFVTNSTFNTAIDKTAQVANALSGNPIATVTKATDIAVVNLKGAMQITKPAPEADTSPDNIAAITGIVNPTITATSGGQSNSQQISGELYRLPDGTKDEYDGSSGKLIKRVGKLVLTGTEAGFAAVSGYSSETMCGFSVKGLTFHNREIGYSEVVSTHLFGTKSTEVLKNKPSVLITILGLYLSVEYTRLGITTESSDPERVSALLSWLAAQAAASTPVTIYYELFPAATTEVRHDLACYAASTTFACADPLATDMSVTVLDGRMVGRSRDAELLAGLHPSTYRQSNRNLIDNGDFRSGCVVNQRGQASYTGAGILTIDRWTQWDDGTLALSDDGVLLSKGSGKEYTAITQTLPNAIASRLHGQTVTFSVETGGAVYTNTGVFNRNSLLLLGPAGIPGTTAYFDIIAFTIGGNPMIRVLNPGDPLLISRAKLELGPVSTLALDPPADYGETLRKCQRYFYRPADKIDFPGRTYTATTGFATLRLPCTMPVNPTISTEFPGKFYDSTGPHNVTSLEVERFSGDSVRIKITGEGFVNGSYPGYLTDTWFSLSAEL